MVQILRTTSSLIFGTISFNCPTITTLALRHLPPLFAAIAGYVGNSRGDVLEVRPKTSQFFSRSRSLLVRALRELSVPYPDLYLHIAPSPPSSSRGYFMVAMGIFIYPTSIRFLCAFLQ